MEGGLRAADDDDDDTGIDVLVQQHSICRLTHS